MSGVSGAFQTECGEWRVRTFLSGALALDGGAMFGSVPRPVWERMIPPDDRHRIPLALRLLILENDTTGRRVLVDGGMGDKEDAAFRDRFAVVGEDLRTSLSAEGVDPDSITDVIITHLHFDHAGGLTRREGDEVVPTLPGARHYLQTSNRDNCLAPNARERASYLRVNIDPLTEIDLQLVDGTAEILPGVSVERSDGHTLGMQTVRVEGGGRVVRYLADLSPTHHHIRLPFTMGYDMSAQTVMAEKEALYEAVREEEAILLFEHDPAVAAATLGEDRGKIVAVPVQ